MQQTVRRLGKAFSAFFRDKNSAGFPRFKKENRFRTIQYSKYGDGCKIKHNKIYMQLVGNIKVKMHKTIIYPIKTISVTKNSRDEYFVNVTCITPKPINYAKGNSVGIDFGIKTTVTTSDNQRIDTPYFDKTKDKTIKRLQRQKNNKALSKVFKKLTNKRKDFNHKLSRNLINEYDIICLEDLKIENLKSYKHVNRKLYAKGINQLINYIKYKAENAGKYVVMVDPSYTTQTCYNCGKRQKLSLKQRKYKCSCGYIEDRDVNAAKNILSLGLQTLSSTST